eukprot:8028320-Pyramimonas_sp.AAC.1
MPAFGVPAHASQKKYETCAPPRQQSRQEQVTRELEADMIADPPGIALPSPSDAYQPAPAATPAAKASPAAYSPKPQQQTPIAQLSGSERPSAHELASASSAQQSLAPTPGATPARHPAGTAAFVPSAEDSAAPD